MSFLILLSKVVLINSFIFTNSFNLNVYNLRNSKYLYLDFEYKVNYVNIDDLIHFNYKNPFYEN